MINRDPDRLRIEVRQQFIQADEHGMVPVADLLSEIEKFTADADHKNMIGLGYGSFGDNPMLIEVRYETDEEWASRMDSIRIHALKVQQSADRNWAKQQRKFAAARKRKEAKANKK